MRVTSHTELLDEHSHDGTCSCGEHHSHATVQLTQTLVGLVLTFNSFLYSWLVEPDSGVASFSALAGALLLGFPIVRVALKDLRRGSLNTNVLVALAVFALVASGHYAEAAIVSFFMLLGQIVETRTSEGALASIHSLVRLTLTRARRIVGEKEEEVPVQQLAVGDIIRVRPGDNVAADGVILAGEGSFNEANITGESLPVDKKAGHDVFAGTSNLTGLLDMRVTPRRRGYDSRTGA